MTGTVPVLSMIFMAVSCAICFLTPLALFLYLRLVKKADIYPFFAGCAVMLLFAFILESGLHSLVFSSPAGPAILNNIWLYALYGGFMAGLFEETGRYLAFSFALKKYRTRRLRGDRHRRFHHDQQYYLVRYDQQREHLVDDQFSARRPVGTGTAVCHSFGNFAFISVPVERRRAAASHRSAYRARQVEWQVLPLSGGDPDPLRC